jgi:hypothetical protein
MLTPWFAVSVGIVVATAFRRSDGARLLARWSPVGAATAYLVYAMLRPERF